MPNQPNESIQLSYDPAWNLLGGGDEPEAVRESFRRLARRGVVALSKRFTDQAEAADFWLNLVHGFHTHRRTTRYASDHWRLKHAFEASAEYCAEQRTRSREASDSKTEDTWALLETEFRASSNSHGDLSAITRRDTHLHRDRYPFGYWLYDHSHEPTPDVKAELDYWKAHVWQGYHILIANCERLAREGMAWANRHEKLNFAIAGLSYDLALLEANYVIDRGLRGDEAMRTFRDESAELLEEVTSSWRASCERLAITFDDDAEEVKNLAQPFHGVRDDLRRLLRELPPETISADSAQGECTTDTTPKERQVTEARAQVDRFIESVLTATGRRITRTDIWRVAGYKEATQFERFQKNRRASSGSIIKFNGILKLKPSEFLARLSKLTVPR
ncbi:MAG: hypothetical protein ABSH56_22530 [Bryobacteraceae bacterium]|jgi:hypothetical protein